MLATPCERNRFFQPCRRVVESCRQNISQPTPTNDSQNPELNTHNGSAINNTITASASACTGARARRENFAMSNAAIMIKARRVGSPKPAMIAYAMANARLATASSSGAGQRNVNRGAIFQSNRIRPTPKLANSAMCNPEIAIRCGMPVARAIDHSSSFIAC